MNFTRTIQLLAVLTALPVVSAKAQVLFYDPFSVDSDSTDVNYEYSSRGQSGTDAPLTYSVSGPTYYTQVGNGPTIGGVTNSQVLLVASHGGIGAGTVSPNADFNDYFAPVESISFDVDPNGGGSSVDTSWLGITFGTANQNEANGNFVNASSALGFILRGNGDFQTFNHGVLVNQGSTGVGAGAFSAIDITLTAENPSGDSFIGLNTLVTITDGGTLLSSFTTSGLTDNYITFMSQPDDTGNDSVSYIDNLTVSAAPEPSVFGYTAMGLGALAFVIYRRRQTAV